MDTLELLVAYIEKEDSRYDYCIHHNYDWAFTASARQGAFMLSLEAAGATYYSLD